MTTTNVPSDQFYDLKRDIEDATRYSNSENVFTNRVGKSIRPIALQAQDIAANLAAAEQALANSGFIPKGDFTAGGTVEAKNEVFSDGTDYWRYDGALPFTVTAGSSPTPTGVGAWINVTDGALRSQLASAESAVLVGGVEAGSLANQYARRKIFAPLLSSNTAAQNSTILQSKIDEANSRYLGGTVGGGGFVVVMPEGKFDYTGVEIKKGASLEGAGINFTVLQLEGDNLKGLYCAATDTGSFADQVSFGYFKGFTLVPKDPNVSQPSNQVMWDAIGFSRWKAEDMYIGWCGGVTGIRATGGVLAGSGGPANWYNTFQNIFMEKPSSWPAGGVGWLLGEGDVNLEQITTWSIIGGRTSGSGLGINIQGANTIAFYEHTIETCDVLISDEAATRLTRNVVFIPAYFEGSGTITIASKAEGTALLGDFVTGYTLNDNSPKTIRHANGQFKSYLGNVAAQEWTVTMANGATRRPVFKSENTAPAFSLENSAGTELVFNNNAASSASNSYFRLLDTDLQNVIFSLGLSQLTLSTDGQGNLGSASNRFNTVFAATGAINTSDERAKTELLDIEEAEKSCAIELKSQIKKFKFLESESEKGDKARIHFGVGAQTVKSVFEKHGLNPESYALFCYDEWADEFEKVEAVLDEDGNVVTPEKIIKRQSAGNRYGIRYEELLCFIISAL